MFDSNLPNLGRVVLIVQELFVKGLGDRDSSQTRDPFYLLCTEDRHDPRDNRDGDLRLSRAIDEVEIEGVVEEELGYNYVGPGVDLALEVREIGREIRRLVVPLGISGHGDAEAVDPFQEGD